VQTPYFSEDNPGSLARSVALGLFVNPESLADTVAAGIMKRVINNTIIVIDILFQLTFSIWSSFYLLELTLFPLNGVRHLYFIFPSFAI
jgi:hypothetical protein